MDYRTNVSEDELYHYGREGMKWGQHIFGKEARVARKRKRVLKKARVQKAKQKKISEQRRKDFEAGKIDPKDMTVDELREYRNKLALQNEVADLKNARNSKTMSAGKTVVNDFMSKAVKAGLEEAGKALIRDKVIDMGKKALGLSGKDTDGAFEALKKEVETLELNKRKTVVEDFYENRAKKQQNSNKQKDKTTDRTSERSTGRNASQTESRSERNARAAAEAAQTVGKSAADTVADAVFSTASSSAATNTGRDYVTKILALPAPKDENER